MPLRSACPPPPPALFAVHDCAPVAAHTTSSHSPGSRWSACHAATGSKKTSDWNRYASIATGSTIPHTTQLHSRVRACVCAPRVRQPPLRRATWHGPGPGQHTGASTGKGGGRTHALRFHAPRVSIHSRTVALSRFSLFVCPWRQPDCVLQRASPGSIRASQAGEHREAGTRTARSFPGRRTTRSHTGRLGPCRALRGSGRAHCPHASRGAARARGAPADDGADAVTLALGPLREHAVRPDRRADGGRPALWVVVERVRAARTARLAVLHMSMPGHR